MITNLHISKKGGNIFNKIILRGEILLDKLSFRSRKRLFIVLVCFALSLAVLSMRVGYIMLFKAEEYQKMAYEQQTRDRLITPKRGAYWTETKGHGGHGIGKRRIGHTCSDRKRGGNG